MYLETNVKCCQNFVKFNKIELTLTYEATIKDCLPKWDRATPIIKKWDFHASNKFVSITELLLRWIKVGWIKVASAQNMRKAWSNSCNLLQKEIDRMNIENIIVLASIVWTEDDKYWTTYGSIYCMMELRGIVRRGYGMVNVCVCLLWVCVCVYVMSVCVCLCVECLNCHIDSFHHWLVQA